MSFFSNLLLSKNLPKHDGRPLWKYMLTDEEFENLLKELKFARLLSVDPRDVAVYYAEWWKKNYDIKNKEHKERMMNADTSYPLLVVVEKGNNLSVADGLNRLYKAIKIEKKKTLPVYIVTKSEIEDLKEKTSKS